MTPRLSEDQRLALEERGGAPVYVVDGTTNTSYVILRAEQFEKLKSDTDSQILEAMYPLLADIEPDDWEDIREYDKTS